MTEPDPVPFPLTPEQASTLLENLRPSMVEGRYADKIVESVLRQGDHAFRIDCQACGREFGEEPFVEVTISDKRFSDNPWWRDVCVDLEACALRCAVKTHEHRS